MIMKVKITRITVLLTAIALFMGVNVSAAEVPYHSYTYWLGYDKKTLVETKEMFKVETVLTAEDLLQPDFAHPTAMASEKDGNLYIIEEATSRLTILDKNFEVKQSITAFADENKN